MEHQEVAGVILFSEFSGFKEDKIYDKRWFL
jgi:hypothetical protein